MKKIKRWLSQIPYIYILSFLFLLYLLFLVFRATYQNWKIDQEMKRMEKEIATLNLENENLQNLILYYQTPSYKERELKRKLGLVEPDEKVVIISKEPPPAKTPSPTPAAEEPKKPNWELWWEFFFGRR